MQNVFPINTLLKEFGEDMINKFHAQDTGVPKFFPVGANNWILKIEIKIENNYTKLRIEIAELISEQREQTFQNSFN